MDGITLFFRDNYSFGHFCVKKFQNMKNDVVISLERKDRKRGACPECGGKCPVRMLRKCRVRDLNLVKKCYIEFEQAEIRCKCGYNGVERLDIINGNEKYTKRFEEWVTNFREAAKPKAAR